MDFDFWFLASGFLFPVYGVWFLVSDFWVLDSGFWFLASGFCLLRLGEPSGRLRGNPGGPGAITAFKKLYKNPLEIPKGIPS